MVRVVLDLVQWRRSRWWQLLMLVPYLGALVLLVLFAQESQPDATNSIVPGAPP